MPSLRTELTEIVTGLGMLGIGCLDGAQDARPAEMPNGTAENFDRLIRTREAGEYGRPFENAWDSDRAFASSAEGLRNRRPERVEWRGSHQPPGYERAPTDLRIDYVYLVGCKYTCNVLSNPSPPISSTGCSPRGAGHG